MARRRWIADEWNGSSAVLRDAAAAHLSRVLRARVGQTFDIVAGGVVRRGVIERIGEGSVEFSLHEEVAAPPLFPVTVGLSVIRFEPMEWAIEKLSELGVARTVPLITERSEKHLAMAATKRVERWRRIARGAAQQSRGATPIELGAPLPLSRWLDENSGEGLRLMLSEVEQSRGLYRFLEEAEIPGAGIALSLGPEGGWTPAEAEAFVQRGWQPITLGPRIRRAETAAIAAVSSLALWLETSAL
jgi:16S rRNA (uracil1498-N3)-methyltransferase